MVLGFWANRHHLSIHPANTPCGGTWWHLAWLVVDVVEASTEPFDVQMEVPLVEQQVASNYNRPSAAAPLDQERRVAVENPRTMNRDGRE